MFVRPDSKLGPRPIHVVATSAARRDIRSAVEQWQARQKDHRPIDPIVMGEAIAAMLHEWRASQ
jgi:hypothetical protein